MKKRHAALLGVLLFPALAFTFGGWAVITVDDLPDYIVAGRQTDVGFVVRRHGFSPMSGITPRVTMTADGAEVSASARPVGEKGHYVASLTVPRAADWAVRIKSGFNSSENSLLPVRAIAAGAPAPSPLADADRGHRLFFAKGCVTCHVRGAEGTEGVRVGPDLTGRRYPPGYVATFLADPEKSPLSKSSTTSMRMPKLDLKDREIASLVAFINSEGPVVGAVR
ncbi:MAG: cytochrome c [Gemmatimonadaceae bacterium]